MADILIVDDEASINDVIKRNLKMVGHICDQAYDGREAVSKIESGHYDLILLDVMLPYLTGFEIIRKVKGTPVIFITAKDNLDDKLCGLTSGAEDYIVKPFDVLELIARINIVLRRTSESGNKVKMNDVVVDMSSKTVTYKQKEVELAPQEYQLLEVLIINRNLALSREKLLELAWGYDFEGDTRTVDVHIQRLRKKLGFEERIKTVYKMGYRLQL